MKILRLKSSIQQIKKREKNIQSIYTKNFKGQDNLKEM